MDQNIGVLGKKQLLQPDREGQGNEQFARWLTQATPAELELLNYLGGTAADADQAVQDETRALYERGQNLDKLDTAYMERAYQPMYERLMNDYNLMDRNILEDMNRRGIAGIPGGPSEPEAYARMLNARETKDAMGRTILESQNQAVQQKLAQYQARTAETGQANTRYDQTMTPLINARVTPESERVNARVGNVNARLGYDASMHQTNTQRKIAGDDRMMSVIGGGMGAAGTALGALAFMSDVNKKTDISEGSTPEESLGDIDDLEVQKWRYKMGGGEHEGAMAQDMPGDMVSDDNSSVDVPTYLGKLTGAIQALNNKMGRFELMMAQGGV